MDGIGIMVFIGIILLFGGLYGTSFWYLCSMTGSNDDWNNVNNTVSLIAGLQVIGAAVFGLAITLMCAAFIGPLNTAYGAVFVAIYASSLAIGAMAVAAMMKA